MSGSGARRRPTSKDPGEHTNQSPPITPDSPDTPPTPTSQPGYRPAIMVLSAIGAVLGAIVIRTYISPATHGTLAWSASDVPSQAQVINQKAFNVLGNVPPATQANGSSVSPLHTIFCPLTLRSSSSPQDTTNRP